jgi:hypothetical protein
MHRGNSSPLGERLGEGELMQSVMLPGEAEAMAAAPHPPIAGALGPSLSPRGEGAGVVMPNTLAANCG